MTGAAKIWVDADACPVVIKEILFRAAERTQLTLTLVANQPLRVPPSKVIHTLQVPAGFDPGLELLGAALGQRAAVVQEQQEMLRTQADELSELRVRLQTLEGEQ